MKNKAPLEDKVYKLKKSYTPLSFILSSRSTKRNALLYFDGEVNRAIRYARNQKSPFEDEQDGNVVLEPIVFTDGFLAVKKENPVLQHFLSLHPDNGRVFMEVDKEKDAEAELEAIELEAEAVSKARGLELTYLEALVRILLGRDPERYTVPEMRRDILLFAKRNPEAFLDAYENPELDFKSKVSIMFSKNLLGLRNSGRDVHYNLTGNKKRMLAVPFGEDPESATAAYLKSEEGLESLKILENYLDQL